MRNQAASRQGYPSRWRAAPGGDILPPMAPVARLVALALLLVTAARGDVVHLKNGNQIRGEVLEEDEEQLLVRTADGRVGIPRRDVVRIERETKARMLLGQAREAARAGDPVRARRLYEQAVAAAEAGPEPEPAVAQKAREELGGLPATGPVALDAAPTLTPGKFRLEPGKDPFQEEEKQALVRELEAALPNNPELRPRLLSELAGRAMSRHRAGECRLAASDWRRAAALASGRDEQVCRQNEQRCRLEVAARALRANDAALAAIAAEPVRESSEAVLARRARYLHGRALELAGDREGARRDYLEVLAGNNLKRGHDLAILRELARLATAGIPIEPSTPGVAETWRRTSTASFEVIHQEADGRALGDTLERARGEVEKRLQLEAPRDRGRVAVFVLPDFDTYRQSPGARSWSAGHAARLRTEDEVVRTIYLYPGASFDDRARHEIAHIVVGDALDDAPLPAWAQEGAAIWAESDALRTQRRQGWRYLQANGQLKPLAELLAQMLPPLTEDADEAMRFYSQAAVAFEGLALASSPPRALKALVRVNEEGPEEALGSLGLTIGSLEARIAELAGAR